ncbi:anti-sigma-F factor Fin family protein [Paludifilum halophilum]|uniref:Peptide ABC transporter permease n=1 Tax=Paludifilum halophilum TaxID=1642702 RepID=A0A235B408_9BACL|nr:anti-sigma-F factor Fin family protein [Paludifilum halophilum]OYD06365.1 hypothetical protein CHM34_16785 [Paludifilum halophilum]
MAITYTCRYCNTHIGRIDDDRVTELQLGFHWLTPDERRDIISYDAAGHSHVRVICETCQEMLEKNPELTLLSHPFQ